LGEREKYFQGRKKSRIIGADIKAFSNRAAIAAPEMGLEAEAIGSKPISNPYYSAVFDRRSTVSVF
jgi:hypothetical protein